MLLNLKGFHAGRGDLKITHATALILLVPLGKSGRGSGKKKLSGSSGGGKTRGGYLWW